MTYETLQAVTYELADLYEKKIAKVRCTSVQYDVYVRLIADLYAEGAQKMAELAIQRANLTDRKAVRNVYRQFTLNYQHIALKYS